MSHAFFRGFLPAKKKEDGRSAPPSDVSCPLKNQAPVMRQRSPVQSVWQAGCVSA